MQIVDGGGNRFLPRCPPLRYVVDAMSPPLYKLRRSEEFVKDLGAIAKNDPAAFAGLRVVLEELQGNEPAIRRWQEQVVGEEKVSIGAASYCYIREFIFAGRVVWRIKPLLDPIKGQGFLTANHYRIFFAPNPNKQEHMFLAVVKRVGVKGDVYDPNHPEHKRICRIYDRYDIGMCRRH